MKQFLGSFFSRVMKRKSWLLLIGLAVAIKLVSFYPAFVERYYTYGLYPVISKVQRFLFGWIPFSLGDLFYGLVLIIIIVKIFQLVRALFLKKISWRFIKTGLKQLIFLLLLVFVFFYFLWGLNYNRKGISDQLNLNVKDYTLADLDTLTQVLQKKLNWYASLFNEAQRDSLKKKRNLFSESYMAYRQAEKKYPFLKYRLSSVKPSIFSYAGNMLGFQGYYNPFSGEAQVNTTVPVIMQPFVACHEIGHQLGYAKENEANFAGFLACRLYADNAFQYSMYFEMYRYAINEIARADTTLAKEYQQNLHPQVKKDLKELKVFFEKYKNPVEPIISRFYHYYLKANNQPAGKRSYNEVVAWLIAYYKKFGVGAL